MVEEEECVDHAIEHDPLVTLRSRYLSVDKNIANVKEFDLV